MNRVKALQKYQCEVCCVEYATEHAALDCEASHKLPQSIVKARHLPKGTGRDGYPVTVTVRMSDGQDITYKR